MVDNGIIEKSLGPLTSPIVLDMKEIGSTRFGVDYRKLNEITIKDSYPVPRIDDTLDALNGSIQCEDSMTAVPIGLANVATWTVRKLNNGSRINELEESPNYFPANQVFMSSRPTVKPLTFDGQTTWTAYKTQFDVVSCANGWTDFVKASQLVTSLRGSAADVLQGIPAGQT
ncbi:hypothetical protein AVEN_201252-1 [Araneus ventricosus]|uniref:Uncharacterized protein n=1 Tax=Araneus ventricosus TaxID=182803 RepID=A0A4Y2X8Z8_ARAVE|nr:hypothetical protein AVEN_176176-1 [Araneus ventricosus]GBO45370.1 hypothetical protein AVEN_201252-1 [Araneus ventricosus]